MRHLIILLPFALAGCISTSRPAPIALTSPFSPAEFFSGHTEGEGTLKTMFSRAQGVRVHGIGHSGKDGALVLDQIIDSRGKPAQHREWRIRDAGIDHFTGTLTQAVGPVGGDVTGNCLHLHFRMKGGLDAEQWLYLSNDRRSAHNFMNIRKLGIVVARLDEIIRKIG